MGNDHRPAPGKSPAVTDTPTAFLKDVDHVIQQRVTISSAARDSGNTPTTTLRPGLIMGMVTATGKFKEYDNSDSDGTETAIGILKHQVKLLDSDGNACDGIAPIVIGGYVDESELHGLNAAAKVDLADRIIFDGDIILEI